MSLLDLSPELLLLIASQVHQVDLLNVSLVCKHLHCVVEPELYREYSNPRLHVRPFLPFIKKLIARPELAKHVRKVDLHAWDSLDIFEPIPNEQGPGRDRDMEAIREHELSQEDYYLAAEAAKTAGVIGAIDPYEPSSRLIDTAKSLGNTDDELHPWYEHIFDDKVGINEVSYDRKFCQILRAGVEDAQAVLLLALLPNVKEVFLRGGPHDINALTWRASHSFESLLDLTVCGTDAELTWPLSFFNHLLSTTRKLKTLRCSGTSSWYRTLGEVEPDPSHVLPLDIQPHSLSCISTIELKYCCLRASDLRSLVKACPGLETLYYYVGTVAQGIPGPPPAIVIEILKPLKNQLRALHLDLPPGYDENSEDPGIGSLTHMTALEILDTSAEMWKNVVEEDFELNDYDTDSSDALPVANSRLYSRLPVSLRELYFHSSESGFQFEPALTQISELIHMQPKVLPSLAKLVIETTDEIYVESLVETIDEQDWHFDTERRLVEVRIGGVPTTVLDTLVLSHHLPDTKWFGHKYSIRHRKPNKLDRALEKMAKAYEEGSRGDTFSGALADDPELEAYFSSLKDPLRVKEPAEYYDTDEDRPCPTSQ